MGHTDVYVRDIVRAAAIEGTCGCQCLNSLPVHLDPAAAVPAPGLVPLQRGPGNIVIGVVGTLFQVSTSLGMRMERGVVGKGSISHAQILSFISPTEVKYSLVHCNFPKTPSSHFSCSLMNEDSSYICFWRS